jgi:hypothetical protein
MRASDVDLLLRWAKSQELFWRNTTEYLVTDLPEYEGMGVADCADVLQARQNVHYYREISREIRRQMANRHTKSVDRKS